MPEALAAQHDLVDQDIAAAHAQDARGKRRAAAAARRARGRARDASGESASSKPRPCAARSRCSRRASTPRGQARDEMRKEVAALDERARARPRAPPTPRRRRTYPHASRVELEKARRRTDQLLEDRVSEGGFRCLGKRAADGIYRTDAAHHIARGKRRQRQAGAEAEPGESASGAASAGERGRRASSSRKRRWRCSPPSSARRKASPRGRLRDAIKALREEQQIEIGLVREELMGRMDAKLFGSTSSMIPARSPRRRSTSCAARSSRASRA